MRRSRTLLMFAVMMLTAAAAVASALIAGSYVPWLGMAVKAGQEHVMAPIASLPALAVGYWIMFRIWKAESARMYRSASTGATEGDGASRT
jgi:hypothetical protein